MTRDAEAEEAELLAKAEAEDNAYAIRNARQRKLLAIHEKVEAAGLDLDELIELIEARQNGSY